MGIDLTDWAILLEALDGTTAPFPSLSTLSAALRRAAPRHDLEAEPFFRLAAPPPRRSYPRRPVPSRPVIVRRAR